MTASSSEEFQKLCVFADSQTIVKLQVRAHAAVGEIFRLAHEPERRDPNPLSVSVEWILGHAGIDGIKRAHRAAIEDLNRIDPRR